MPEATKISEAEAKAFAARHGLTWCTPQDLAALRSGMERAFDAGQKVPRVATKFDGPAPVFRVAEIP